LTGRSKAQCVERILYSIPEAAPLLGRKPDALRREIERRAVPDSGDPHQVVAALAGGIRAYRLASGGRWQLAIPANLRN
jgi:hypothetical protein